MFVILFFTIIGFLIGLGVALRKRKIRPGRLLVATFLGLLSLGIWKIFKDYKKRRYDT